MQRRDVSTFDVQMDLVSVFAPDGSVQYRVATMQDINARKRAQAALQESEERYRGIVNNVMDSIFILDLQGRMMLDGQPAILCLCHDITERKQAEEKIKRSRADLERAKAIAHVGSWSMDLVTNRIEWSKENYRIFGIESGTPISYDTFFSYVHPAGHRARAH